MNMQTAGLVFLFFLFLFKIYVFIIFKYTVAVFRHSRRGCQILENLNPSSCLHMMYINTASHILIKIERWVYRNGSTVKSSVSSSREPGLNYQYIYIYIWWPISSSRGSNTLFCLLWSQNTHAKHPYTKNKIDH